MSISSVILMNFLNTFDNPAPSFLILAGFGGWLGLMWAVNAQEEPLIGRLFAPVVSALAMLGISNTIHVVLLVCFAILSFVIRAMFHPIPLSLGILTLSALSSVVYFKRLFRQQIRQSLDEAFRYTPPAIAAAQEVLDNLNQEEGNQEEGNQVDSDEEEAYDDLNDAMTEEEEQQDDDDTVVDDNQTIQSEEDDNVVMAPANLPISPLDSPGFPAQQAPLYVIEPMPQIELMPAGGAGDVYPANASPNPHA